MPLTVNKILSYFPECLKGDVIDIIIVTQNEDNAEVSDAINNGNKGNPEIDPPYREK